MYNFFMTIENPLYDTSIGGAKAKSRTGAEVEYRVFKTLKMFFNFFGIGFSALIRMGGDMIKEVVRPGSSRRA
jgi:hypothetical protein